MYDCKLCGVTTMPNNKKFDPDAIQRHIFLYHPGIEDRYGWKEATRLVKEGKITVTLSVEEYLKIREDESPL